MTTGYGNQLTHTENIEKKDTGQSWSILVGRFEGGSFVRKVSVENVRGMMDIHVIRIKYIVI